ncbi:FecR domain-containing protein [Sulfidibacter corallicola]|uniref:FecR domain-containing protein n=1 Tax=Sulfidibacter corallicola TaxID=2818388 RepID=A0A8A4TE26_SULCO|nr:DUF6600 domain-containing protein [Sulfidibacter corallicola]QTD48196.1 FecR domain-containing protein [Sulfidibacter corallicola]
MRYLMLMILPLTFMGSAFAWDDPNEEIVDTYDEAEQTQGERYARVTYAGKHVGLTHEDGYEEDAIRNLPVVSGDMIKTRGSSYAEIEFLDGSLMQFDDRTEVEFQAINETYQNESLSVIKLYDGSIFLHVADEREGLESRVYRIDTEDGSTYIEAPGIYRIDLENGRTKVKVFRGYAELSGEADSQLIYSGEYATIKNMYAPSRTRSFNSFHGDRFERWSYERRPWTRTVSSKYVSPHLVSYSRDLDDHGEWRYHHDLQIHVWVPFVKSGWRPYYNGYWTTRRHRMTWVSYEPFGYVTHHYGRWGWTVDFGWHWIPGRYYSPAWVAWTSYDNYVGWCPLGYYNRPYYYGRRGYNRVVLNYHSNHYWHYVDVDVVVNRRRVLPYRSAIPRHSSRRVVTTRSITVTRDDLSSGRSFSRVVRDPGVNRARSTRALASRGAIRVQDRVGTTGSSSRVTRRTTAVPIQSRATGTKAVSRHTNVTRSTASSRSVIRRDRGDSGITTYRRAGTTSDSSRTTRGTASSSRTTRGTTSNSSRTTRSQALPRSYRNLDSKENQVQQRPRSSRTVTPNPTTRRTVPSRSTGTRTPTQTAPSRSSEPSRRVTPTRSSEPVRQRDQGASNSRSRSSATPARSSRTTRSTNSRATGSRYNAPSRSAVPSNSRVRETGASRSSSRSSSRQSASPAPRTRQRSQSAAPSRSRQPTRSASPSRSTSGSRQQASPSRSTRSRSSATPRSGSNSSKSQRAPIRRRDHND